LLFAPDIVCSLLCSVFFNIVYRRGAGKRPVKFAPMRAGTNIPARFVAYEPYIR
jgi:hypothetical protein